MSKTSTQQAELRELTLRSRLDQGLPPHVVDPAALRVVARIVEGSAQLDELGCSAPSKLSTGSQRRAAS